MFILIMNIGVYQIEIFTALPSYKFPQFILPIDDKQVIIQKIKHLKSKSIFRYASYLLAHSNYLYKKIGPDFVILCRK